MKNNITAIRRLKKSDNNRVARYVILAKISPYLYNDIWQLKCHTVHVHVYQCVCSVTMYHLLSTLRACGATICNRTDEVKESDIGIGCGLFEIRKIGDEYFTYLIECKDPKACTIVLRGASKDILHEVSLHYPVFVANFERP